MHARRERTTSARDPRAIRATVRSLAGRTVREEVVAQRKELLESCRESRPQHGLLPGKPSTWPPAPCAGGDSPACAMRLDTSTSDHASSAPSRAYTSATVAWTACAQSCEGERFAAPRQTVSRRFRAPAFAGGHSISLPPFFQRYSPPDLRLAR